MSHESSHPPHGSTASADAAAELLRAIHDLRSTLGTGTGIAPTTVGEGADRAPASIPPPPSEAAELGPWLDRLHGTVVDLAHDRRNLRHQLSALIEIVEARSEDWREPLPRPGPHAAPVPRPENAVRGWVKSKVHGAAHSAAGLLRLLRLRLLPPARLVSAHTVDAPALPSSGWLGRLPHGLLGEHGELGALAATSRSAGDWAVEGCALTPGEGAWRFRLVGERGGVLAEGELRRPEDLRRHCRSDVCSDLGRLDLGPSGIGDAAPGPVPRGWILLARLVMAVEGLRFLHVRGGPEAGGSTGPAAGLLFARWSWWHPETGLDRDRLERASPAEILGKVVDLDRIPVPGERPGRPPMAGVRLGDPPIPGDTPLRELAPARAGEPQRGLTALGPYRLRGDSKPRLFRLPRKLGLPDPVDGLPTTALVLTCPLEAGVDRWVSALLASEASAEAAPARRHAVALLPAEGPRPAHPLIELGPLTGWLLPVAPFGDSGPAADGVSGSLAACLLAQALALLGTDRIVHLGPGRGFFDDPAILRFLEASRTELVDLPSPAPLADGPAPGRPAGARRLGPFAEDTPADPTTLAGWPLPSGWTGPIPARADARRRLGLPGEDTVGGARRIVAQIGDMVPGEDPEAFVDLAHALRERDDLLFLLVGRGPLEAAVDARARHLGLRHFVRLASADDRAVIGAADLLCSTAPHPVLPWSPALALLAGRPALALDGPAYRSGPWRPALDAGDLVLAGGGPAGGDAPSLARAVEDLLDRAPEESAIEAEIPEPVATYRHLLPTPAWRDRLFEKPW